MRPINYVLTLALIGVLSITWTTVARSNDNAISNGGASVFASATVTSDSTNAGSGVRSTTGDNIIYFTMTMPERAGQQFSMLSFSFTQPNQSKRLVPIPFDLPKSKALLGTPNAAGKAVDIKGAWIDEMGTAWIEFNQPIPPKTTFTIALPTQKLSSSESYSYGVAAYSGGNSPAVFVEDGILKLG